MRTIERVGKLFRVSKDFKPSDDYFPTGIEIFDNAMEGGFREGELITISGPTGMGKTTFMQNLTVNFHSIEVPSLWFTFEGNIWSLKEKFVRMGCDKTLMAYVPSTGLEENLKFIKDIIVEANEDHLCKIVFIDHLHRLIPLKDARMNIPMLVGSIVAEIKKIAVETNTIIVLAAHTKKVYEDEGLSLNSIRDSALIANESDYVYLIERLQKDKKKGNKPLSDKLEHSGSDWTNIAKIQLAKNRPFGTLVYRKFDVVNHKFIEKE